MRSCLVRAVWRVGFVGALGLSALVGAQAMSVGLEVDSAVLQVGEPISGRVLLDVTGWKPGMVATVFLFCSTSGGGTIPPAIEVSQMSADRRRDVLRAYRDAFSKGRRHAIRAFERPIERDGRVVFSFSESDGVRLIDLTSGRRVPAGKCQMAALVAVSGDELEEFYLDAATVTVKALVPRLTITSAKVDPTTPPRPLTPFTVILNYEMEGLPTEPGVSVNVRRQASVKERKALKDRPYQNSRADTTSVPGSGDGKGAFEKRWRATLPRPGTYDFEFEVTSPGLRNASKKLVVTVPAAPSAAPAPKPGPGRKATTEWVLQHSIGDPDRLEGKALYAGSLSGVSANGYTANYDQVFKVSNGYAPNSKMKVSVAGTPPPRLRAGDRFQMTISATAEKLGMDKCADGREPGEQASADLRASSHIKVTATPHSSGIVFPDAQDGTAVCAGGYFGKWWGADSRTYTLEVVDANAGGDLTIAAYFPGFGQFARYVYVRAKAAQPEGNGQGPAPGTKPTPQLVAEDEYPALSVTLEPSEIEVSPRNAISTLATLKIKGDRPNWKPVEVLIDTVDAWGTLRMCRYLKIEGKGRRETGDMWKTNDGAFHWNLNVLANLGVFGGTYLVPITVRQAGHGQVVRWLTIRVPLDARRPGPSVTRIADPGSLAALFETATLTLKPDGVGVRNRLYVGGSVEGDEPVSLSFSEATAGAFPGGLRVLPGEATVFVADADKETRDGVTRLVFDLTFSADTTAAIGTRTVRAIVRQGGREAPALLVVRIVPS